VPDPGLLPRRPQPDEALAREMDDDVVPLEPRGVDLPSRRVPVRGARSARPAPAPYQPRHLVPVGTEPLDQRGPDQPARAGDRDAHALSAGAPPAGDRGFTRRAGPAILCIRGASTRDGTPRLGVSPARPRGLRVTAGGGARGGQRCRSRVTPWSSPCPARSRTASFRTDFAYSAFSRSSISARRLNSRFGSRGGCFASAYAASSGSAIVESV